MRLYIKSKFTKQLSFGYEELAHKMWFKEREGKELSLSHSGNDEMLQEDCYIWLSYNKWNNDNRWCNKKIVDLHSPLRREMLGMEFENAFISDYREKGDCLRLTSSHQTILTVDKRAIYIMAIEVASALEGLISEDDKNTWLTIEEFRSKHQDVLSLTFEEANEQSLEEITTMEAIEEPLWEELDRLREAYITKHGDRVYPDDEE
ncbi:hypothetical protein [Streptococcus acidominimus]|uniref:Uncharacterized protein n=1 Tax=Streptococcus acidominimus TaxID=1326 RepID=A0A4Y9FLN2_STRAI|nr:hypothetical protein [Streptococcus acidominimus]MBF0819299.1 hypothetical protein [Streptococcus acidominimus]MBF0839637.1 hypothetical protein [Streptococcus acidominimus]MBF0848979.1 hypothetical protein [Streptococcus danieliae]TFU30084.1 hypothetical protein E4U01_07570 [Streptococcus acidominimus]